MRTVLSIQSDFDPATDAEKLKVRVVRSSFNAFRAEFNYPLSLVAREQADWGLPDGVLLRGRAVRDSLKLHPGVGEILKQLFAAPIGQKQPLFVMLAQSEAEQISWETLCDGNDQFVALDPRWPIARITDPTSGGLRPPAALRLPVRLMALISAIGIDGQVKEWRALRDAVVAARAAGLPVAVKVMVGEPSLLQAVSDDIAKFGGGLADVEVTSIAKTATAVVQDIGAWSPNILHVFCHGRSDELEQSIELANGLDYANVDAKTSSVRIRVNQLATLGMSLANPWLLTLNCCSGGRAASNLHSMAHQVVSNGFPAAVAMLEPVDAGDAHEFTRAFYRSLFTSIGAAVVSLKTAAQVSFEWCDAMVYARTAISELHQSDSGNAREWTLPVLYVRGVEPFTFDRPIAGPEPEADAYRAKARLVAEWLQAVGQEKDEKDLRFVMARTLDDVPEAFWPKVDGTF